MNYNRILYIIGLYIIIAIPLFLVALNFINIEPEQIYASIFNQDILDDTIIIVDNADDITNIEPASGK